MTTVSVCCNASARVLMKCALSSEIRAKLSPITQLGPVRQSSNDPSGLLWHTGRQRVVQQHKDAWLEPELQSSENRPITRYISWSSASSRAPTNRVGDYFESKRSRTWHVRGADAMHRSASRQDSRTAFRVVHDKIRCNYFIWRTRNHFIEARLALLLR